MEPAGQLIDRWIVAHRGVSAKCPENSRSAFEAAVACGADAIECDLQLTADGQIVVCHNSSLDEFGHPGVRIAETSLNDLQTLDVGSWFAKDFSGERLMSLPELLKDFGHQIPLLLELKTDDISTQKTERLVDGVLAELKQTPSTKQAMILCFDWQVLARIHELCDNIPLVWNTVRPDLITENDIADKPWLSSIDGQIQHMTDDAVRLFHERQLSAFSFTCNTKEDVLKAWDLQLDGLITDNPDATRGILSTHQRTQP